MSIKGLEMLREHMSYYDFNPDSVLLLGNVLYYLKQAEGEVAELESENKKIRELVRELWEGYADPPCEDCPFRDTPTCADCPICARETAVIDRMRELGIEVGE